MEYLRAVQGEAKNELAAMESDFADFRQSVRSRSDHIRKLILEHTRRREILELQHAQRGNQTDPSILMEIQDIRVELDTLRQELMEAEIKSGYLGAGK